MEIIVYGALGIAIALVVVGLIGVASMLGGR